MTAHPPAPGSFEAMYRTTPDPWRFRDDPYERARYAAVVAALPPEPIGSAFEPGCSIGELTALVAPRCARYLALDVSPTAVARARRRCADLPHVEVRVGALPDDVPAETIDLLLLCEIGYYFDVPTWTAIAGALRDRLTGAGTVVACHWLGSSPDHVLGGRVVHDVLADVLGPPSTSAPDRGYRLQTWRVGP